MINKERAISEFIELVSVPCQSLYERQEADMIIKKMQELGLEVKVDEANKQYNSTTGNVWGFLQGNKQGAKRLLFAAHMDSVAPTTGTKVVRKDGILYSDGTTTLGGDDKVGIEACLEAIRVLKEDNIPHGDIQILCTIGEEIGCRGGRAINPSWLKADYGYCLDQSGAVGTIYNYSPQATLLTFKIKGRAAHAGSAPEQGINAIMLAAEGLSALPWYGRLDEYTTLSIGTIKGGAATNIVPEDCEFSIDMRCPDVKKLENLKDSTIEIIRQKVEEGNGKLEIKEFVLGPAVFVQDDDASAQLSAKAASNMGLKPHFAFSGGITDANHLCGFGLTTICLGVGMTKIHTTEEQLSEKDLIDTTRWVIEIIKEAAKV